MGIQSRVRVAFATAKGAERSRLVRAGGERRGRPRGALCERSGALGDVLGGARGRESTHELVRLRSRDVLDPVARDLRRGGVETAHGVVETHARQAHVHLAEIRVVVQRASASSRLRRTSLWIFAVFGAVERRALSFVFVFVFVLLFVLVVPVEERRQERRGAPVEARAQGQTGHAERKLGRRGVGDAAGVRGRRRAFFGFRRRLFCSA